MWVWIDKKDVSTMQEFDYDRFAEAIVAANRKSRDERAKRTASRELMKFILIPILYGISILCGLFSVAGFVFTIQHISSFSVSFADAVSQVLFPLILGLFMAALTVFTFLSAREIGDETDRDYVASLFSNVVSFAAFIIALVALFREVL